MIGERVRVVKKGGETFFAVAKRWEDSGILVVTPEDGSAFEKRAYVSQGDVVTTVTKGQTQVAPKKNYKDLVEGMRDGTERIHKYTKMTEDMQ